MRLTTTLTILFPTLVTSATVNCSWSNVQNVPSGDGTKDCQINSLPDSTVTRAYCGTMGYVDISPGTGNQPGKMHLYNTSNDKSITLVVSIRPASGTNTFISTTMKVGEDCERTFAEPSKVERVTFRLV
ncbi:hypothetical protein J1614_006405 [Plenodomus biglobosus]|nr:hypothetical protein J1614_006405 [Plenodomus biglobosus]